MCWNFRKGRCRFGSNCTFAHDSDLHKQIDEQKTVQKNDELQVHLEIYIREIFFI